MSSQPESFCLNIFVGWLSTQVVQSIETSFQLISIVSPAWYALLSVDIVCITEKDVSIPEKDKKAMTTTNVAKPARIKSFIFMVQYALGAIY